jgi:hypothetical protein
MGLGLKVKNAVDRFGKKSTNVINQFGKKANNTINALDNMANKVIDKSGGVTDGLRIGAKIGSQIIHGLNESGLSEIPVVGKLTSAVDKGVRQLSRGATKLDQFRDNVKERKDNMADSARAFTANSQSRALQFT